MAVRLYDIESLSGFQNDDRSEDWKSHDPSFEWSPEVLAEFELEAAHQQQELDAMAGWLVGN